MLMFQKFRGFRKFSKVDGETTLDGDSRISQGKLSGEKPRETRPTEARNHCERLIRCLRTGRGFKNPLIHESGRNDIAHRLTVAPAAS
jgi:hypothetical protein